MEIVKDYIPVAKNKRPGTKIKPAYLTIHSTGNTDSNAKNERDWLANPENTRAASWHVCVDDSRAIQAVPLDEIAFHAGTAEGNKNSISLEICESGDREKTLKNAVIVAAQLLKQYGWDESRLKQHYDWSGKDCPRILRDTGRWDWFVKQVRKELYGVAKFTDTKGHWAEKQIDELVEMGIINGFEDGTFRPDEPVTRAQMAVVARNIVRYITGK